MKCEFLCIIILVVLFIYAILIRKEMVRREFDRMAVTVVLQLTAEYLTIFLLNLKNKDATLVIISKVVSVIYILLALFFCYTFLKYISLLVFSITVTKKISLVGVIPLVVYLFAAPFCDFEYIKGNVIYYLGGIYVEFWLVICMVYIAIASIVLIVNRQRIEKKIVLMFETIAFLMIMLIYIQFIYPEMYVLGATFTLTVLSTYLSIEYDANGNNYRMSIDLDTGVKNKKAYKEDINKINKKHFQEESPVEKITFVLFDIDNMKGINEKQGLVTGDEIISKTAKIISRSLKAVQNIYRIRGDVFAAVYIGEDESDIVTGCKLVKTEVARINKEVSFDYNVAIAMISKENTEVSSMDEIISLANKELDKQKEILRKKMNG